MAERGKKGFRTTLGSIKKAVKMVTSKENTPAQVAKMFAKDDVTAETVKNWVEDDKNLDSTAFNAKYGAKKAAKTGKRVSTYDPETVLKNIVTELNTEKEQLLHRIKEIDARVAKTEKALRALAS